MLFRRTKNRVAKRRGTTEREGPSGVQNGKKWLSRDRNKGGDYDQMMLLNIMPMSNLQK